MALPSSGGNYAQEFQPGVDPTKARKYPVVDLVMRDYRAPDGTVRDLSDPAVGLGDDGFFSPFSADGLIRSDLLGEAPNLGFYHLGYLHEDGIEMTEDTDVSEGMAAQSKKAIRYDVMKDNAGITIKALESTPIIDAIRYDLPLDSLQDYGKAGYGIRKPAETPLIERQVIAFGFDGNNMVAKVFPRMALKSRATTNWNKEDFDVMEIELGSLLCPYVGTDVILRRDGADWRGLQGNHLFAAAPVATAVAGQLADVVFAKPTSKSSTLDYVVEKSNDGLTGWTEATAVDTSGTTTITIRVSGITSSATWYFRVKATGSNAITTTSAVTASSIIGLS